MSRKGCEQPILGVRTDPGADGVVVGGNLDTHDSCRTRQGLRQQDMARDCSASGSDRTGLGGETVLLHLAPERHGADFQCLSRIAPVAAKPLERSLNRGAFQGLQIQTVVTSPLATASATLPEATRAV